MQDTLPGKPQRLVRKQLLLTQGQSARLKTLAATSARSEAELVREALDAWLATQQAGEEDWKRSLLALAGSLKDADGLERRIAENRKGWNRRIDDAGLGKRGGDSGD
jgi:hypothetical protein